MNDAEREHIRRARLRHFDTSSSTLRKAEGYARQMHHNVLANQDSRLKTQQPEFILPEVTLCNTSEQSRKRQRIHSDEYGDASAHSTCLSPMRANQGASSPSAAAASSSSSYSSLSSTRRVYKIAESIVAWNVDGSSDAKAITGSWIRDAELATGRRRGMCSYLGCNKAAEVGGHIYIAQQGFFIAPICSACNSHTNVDRMQGAKARLRANIEVTRVEETQGMRNADRRIAVPVRRCQICRHDITDRPDNHTQCLECYHRGGYDPVGRVGGRRRGYR